uniref:Uncharacterized protein n=1 Tax=Caenorhabditis japonica TaxID=281687 RepID=A0A8R1HRY4_CAEJA
MGDLYVNLPDLAPNHDGDTYMNLSDLPKNKPPPPLPVKTPPRTPPRTPPQTPPRTPPNRQSGHITPPRHGAHKYPKPFVATGRRTHSNSPSHSPVKVRTPPPKQPVHRPAKHASPEKETDISLSPSIAPTVSVAPTMNMTMGAEVSSVDMEESDSGFEVLVSYSIFPF